jgi:signal transduction histidine kinase
MSTRIQLIAALAVAAGTAVSWPAAPLAAGGDGETEAVATMARPARSYHATRVLTAGTAKPGSEGWMEVATSYQAGRGMSYEVTAEGGADRMRGILQDLLELSRLEAQGGQAERAPVDVAGMLALVRKDALARPERPATVGLRLDSDDLLLGSESQLHSIFSNLVSNAVKYTPASGRVGIRWWTDAHGGHVEVSDTGIGIPAEHLPRLTERFYRVDAGRSRKLGGSGLGLAIVKHALQRHEARLDVRSVEGQGSTFSCHFPPDRVAPRSAHGA